MALAVRVGSAAFSKALVTGLPTVPGLSTNVFFGTGYDGVESNRVAGGPALVVTTGTPVHSSNCVQLGNLNLAGTAASIDTQNPRTAAVLASGATWAACARQAAGAVSLFECIADGTYQIVLSPSAKQVQLYSGGLQANVPFTGAATNWRFIAGTIGAGARGVVTIYDLTENGTPGTYARGTDLTANNQSVRLGCPTAGGFDDDPVDIAWAMVANSPLSQSALVTLVASVRSFLALRGISA